MRLNDIGGKLTEGYSVVPGFDRDKYQERQGLEGPFSTKSGKVVYYDKVEGKYYDPDTDMYIEYDDWRAMNEAGEDTFMSALKGLRSWQVVIMNNFYRGKYSDYSGRYYYVLATSPEEAKQVVLDNADAILQDLLSMKSVNGKKILPRGSAISNFSYFPILVEDRYPISRDDLYQNLKDEGVMARRYFYPLISEFPMYRNSASAKIENLHVAFAAAKRILCLPIYPGLDNGSIERIANIIRKA